MQRKFLKNLWYEIEYYSFTLMAFTSLAIVILDLFGMLNLFPWLSGRITILTLLMLSLVLFTLLADRKRSLEHINSKLTDLQLNRLGDLIHEIDPKLAQVFGDHIVSLIGNLESALNEQKIQFNDLYLFRYYCRKIMEAQPKATFYATSIPSERYFWRNVYSEQAILKFTAGGGSFKRIFFLDHTVDEITIEERDILDRQIEIGVEVYVTYAPQTPKKLRRLFAVESKGTIGWEVTTGPTREIDHVVVTSRPSLIKDLSIIFQDLLELADTKEYKTIKS